MKTVQTRLRRRSTRAGPVALAAVGTVGLVTELGGDGGWDGAAWFGLGLPVAVCLRFGGLRR